jgi:hypothetical protein
MNLQRSVAGRGMQSGMPFQLTERDKRMTATRKMLLMLILLLASTIIASGQEGLGQIGPPKGAIIGAGFGLAAVTGAILYFSLHRQSVTGCVRLVDGANSILDISENRTYRLIDATSTTRVGQRVKLQGKKKKDGQGNISFRVTKLKHDYGPCH